MIESRYKHLELHHSNGDMIGPAPRRYLRGMRCRISHVIPHGNGPACTSTDLENRRRGRLAALQSLRFETHEKDGRK